MITAIGFFVLGVLLGGAVAAAILIARQSRLAAEGARLRAELDAALRVADAQRTELGQTQAQLRDAFAARAQETAREMTQLRTALDGGSSK